MKTLNNAIHTDADGAMMDAPGRMLIMPVFRQDDRFTDKTHLEDMILALVSLYGDVGVDALEQTLATCIRSVASTPDEIHKASADIAERVLQLAMVDDGLVWEQAAVVAFTRAGITSLPLETVTRAPSTIPSVLQ